MLGTRKNGRWRIAPQGEYTATRRYRPGTMILETEFETADGAVTLIDFMPVRTQNPDIVRTVVGKRGRVRMWLEYIVRFDYGSAVPWVTRPHDKHGIPAVARPDKGMLFSAGPLQSGGFTPHPPFEIGERGGPRFLAPHCPSHFKDPPP